MWDLDSGKVIREFKHGHSSHIFDVKFDVRRIVRYVHSLSFPMHQILIVFFMLSTSHDQKIVVLDFGYDLDTTLLV